MTTTVLTQSTTETTTKRREPLRTIDIDMATTQAQARPAPSTGSGSRGRGRGKRNSTRLSVNEQERNEENGNGNVKMSEKKRKTAAYDEDVEGFQFSRLPSKKPRPSIEAIPEVPDAAPEKPVSKPSPRKGRPRKRPLEEKTAEVVEERPKRQTRAKKPATEPETQPENIQSSLRNHDQPDAVPAEKKRRKGRPSKSKTEERNGFVSPEPQPSGTAKITLPMADTPVMQRNKDMRTAAKSEKGNRRSSLGMRGRRASSLIDSGASNALPHKEVKATEFYKHIASDLPEPRRMRQLLIWCATRAIGDKPSGSRSEDESARLAARVIQEELLKDFSTNSELSNWFAREDTAPPAIVVKKPHPKNVQNADKIKELEEQIQKLQRERHSLNALLRPPSVPRIKPPISNGSDAQQPAPSQPESSTSRADRIDLSLLDPSQQKLFASLQPGTTQPEPESSTSATPLPPIPPSAVASRLSRITSGLAPTLDTLAAGVHDIELYRSMSDRVSSRVLRICAGRLDERDARNAMDRLAIEGDSDEDSKEKGRVLQKRPPPREDIGVILGALSRVERR